MCRVDWLRILFCLTVALQTACSSSIPDVSSKKRSSNVATTEKDGIVTASLSASSTSDQVAVASASSNVADSAIIFPPGALAVAAEVALGEAEDQSSAVVAEAGLTAVIVKTSSPLFAAPASGDVPTVTQALTLMLPLPVSELGLGLTAAPSKLVFLYAILTEDGWKSGVKPLTSENLVGTFLKTPIKGLGYFQIAYLSEKVEEVEVTTQIRPKLK